MTSNTSKVRRLNSSSPAPLADDTLAMGHRRSSNSSSASTVAAEPASSASGAGLDELRRRTFEVFDVIRVYTKQPGKAADRRAPFALPRGSTVGDLAARIHKDLLADLKFARVWGPSAFDGQAVHRDHVLAEGDVVEIHST
jgi:ribosome-interacting GTPase 1